MASIISMRIGANSFVLAAGGGLGGGGKGRRRGSGIEGAHAYTRWRNPFSIWQNVGGGVFLLHDNMNYARIDLTFSYYEQH